MSHLCLLQEKKKKKKRGGLGKARKESKVFWKDKRKKLFSLVVEVTLSLLFLFLNAVGQAGWKSHQGISSFIIVQSMGSWSSLSLPSRQKTQPEHSVDEQSGTSDSRGGRLQPCYLLFQNFIPSPKGLWKQDMFLLHADVFWEHVSFKIKKDISNISYLSCSITNSQTCFHI